MQHNVRRLPGIFNVFVQFFQIGIQPIPSCYMAEKENATSK